MCKTNQDKDSCWTSLLSGGAFPADALTAHEMRKKLDLERFQMENPGFDFSGAKLDKKYDDKYIKDMEKIALSAQEEQQQPKKEEEGSDAKEIFL